MRTSLIEIKQIEEHLFQTDGAETAAVFEARLILDKELRDQLDWQRKTYQFIHNYSRKKLKMELNNIHEKLFSAPRHRSFSEKIRRLFDK